MLVSERHRRLFVEEGDHEALASMLPDSRHVDLKGRRFLAVPHTLDAVRLLRRLDLPAPGPILHHYDWPGVHPPFHHQRMTADFLTLNPRAFCLNGMGTGKTLSALWAFDYLRRAGVLDWCVVVSPLSTLERAWADEVFRNFAELNSAVLHGSLSRRLKLIAQGADVFIMNHDGVRSDEVVSALRALPGTGLVIVDELATFRNAPTQRWKRLNRLVNGEPKSDLPPMPWVWGMTGTPMPNEATDVWAQVRLVQPDNVPRHFGTFRDRLMNKVGMFKYVPREDAISQAFAVMQPSIRFRREDCIDLPPTTYVDRDVPLTDEQKFLYASMSARYVMEFEEGRVTALNEAVKIGKLLQIVTASIYRPAGAAPYLVPAKPRIDAVREAIEQSEGKVIVFCPITAAVHRLADELRSSSTVEVITGATPKGERDRIFSEFQSPWGARVLVANPGTMSHGLTLTEASTIVWYAPTNSAETYQQANMRIVRPGQKRNTLILRLSGSPMERKMYRRLDGREGQQSSFLDLMKGE